MASKEESINLLAHMEVLRSFSPSKTEASMEQNLHSHTHHDSIVCQWMATEDDLGMAWVLYAKRRA